MSDKSVIVKQNPENEIPVEVLAEHIERLSKVGAQLDASRLNRKAIVLLLHDITKVPKRDIEFILNALPRLKDFYLKRPAAKA